MSMFHRTSWRRFRFGLQTALGLPARGFFIPYRYAAKMPDTQPVYGELARIFDAKRAVFTDFCQSLDQFSKDFSTFGSVSHSAPKWEQGWFPRLDGAVAYGLVRMRRPKTIIEVGSGHSTRFMARAIKDGEFICRQVAIDPAPRKAIKTLPVEWCAELLTLNHVNMFAELEAGDIAFFDASHILMPGTDVDLILNRIMPVLKPGVLIHIHDVFLPDPYPKTWLWRGYNEQNALGPLIASGTYNLVFASAYVASRMQAEMAGTKLNDIPFNTDFFESSIWLEKQG